VTLNNGGKIQPQRNQH